MSSSDRAAARRRSARTFGAIAGGLAVAGGIVAATDLASVQAIPTRGQSPDQARRDRYECHNWAIEQTGVMPKRVDPAEEAAVDRAKTAERVLTGAGIGGAVGGLARATQDEDLLPGAFAGAIVGATVGAIIDRGDKTDEPDPELEEYLRALSACLEARGYEVVVPSGPQGEAEKSRDENRD
jgi:hypothetical protein